MTVMPSALLQRIVLGAQVVGADHHHGYPRLNPLQLAVLQSPQDVLRLVAAMPKLAAFKGSKHSFQTSLPLWRAGAVMESPMKKTSMCLVFQFDKTIGRADQPLSLRKPV